MPLYSPRPVSCGGGSVSPKLLSPHFQLSFSSSCLGGVSSGTAEQVSRQGSYAMGPSSSSPFWFTWEHELGEVTVSPVVLEGSPQGLRLTC